LTQRILRFAPLTVNFLQELRDMDVDLFVITTPLLLPRVKSFSCGDLFGLTAFVRVDSVIEAEVRE